jgi:uncharacterized protein with GYD domain
MPTFITLYKWTDKAIANLKSSPERMEANIKAAEAAGGKVLGAWITLGEYDVVAVSEWPDDQAAVAALLNQVSQGYVHTTTLKAFTPAEFKQIMTKLP